MSESMGIAAFSVFFKGPFRVDRRRSIVRFGSKCFTFEFLEDLLIQAGAESPMGQQIESVLKRCRGTA